MFIKKVGTNMSELRADFTDTISQLKKHFLKLFLWMAVAKVLGTILFEILAAVCTPSSVIYLILSFLLTMLNIFVIDTIMFLFIKTVRNQPFHIVDIVSSAKMILYHIVMGLVLSFLQSFMQQLSYFLYMIPILAYVIIFFLQAFFLYWNAIVAYAIYDQNKTLKDYIGGACRMLLTNYKMIIVMSIPYIVLCIFSQTIASSVFTTVFGNVDNFSHMIYSLANAKTGILSVVMTYVLYYGVQIAFMVVMLQMIANLYNRYAYLYMPNEQPFLGKGER